MRNQVNAMETGEGENVVSASVLLKMLLLSGLRTTHNKPCTFCIKCSSQIY